MTLSLVLLSAGLFMGWSLGGNDAANIFGTAVGTKMVRFKDAALICVVFITLGAVLSGSGASHTIGSLGHMQSLTDAFVVSVSAALTVAWMTRNGLPVSTSQALVGSIIGWNLFTASPIPMHLVYKIAGTWLFAPVLAALFSMVLYGFVRLFFRVSKIGLIHRDHYTRWGLIIVGAFGAYALGANNIANVMGVYVPVSPFKDISLFGNFLFSGTDQLFLLGALAIGLGVVTYSKRVMLTVGKSIFKLSPVAALIVVLSSSLVLFVFSSEGLNGLLLNAGLPQVPLVPVSQSQAVIGAIIGIGMAKGGRNIRFKALFKIAIGWFLTPLFALVLAFFIMSTRIWIKLW